jgi:hypothetical protein
MPIELTAHTAAGARLVSIAEELSPELATRAAEPDDDGSYPFGAIDAHEAAGYLTAPVPVELGGLGVSFAYDLVVASSRPASGKASVAIGANMHLVAVLNMERRRHVAPAAGAERRAGGFASSLEQIARDGVVLAAAISERGQDLRRPSTLASRTESGIRGGFRAGDPVPYMERNLIAGLLHAAASLCNAESAAAIAVGGTARRIASVRVPRSTHPNTKGATHVSVPVPQADGPEARPAAAPHLTATSRGLTIASHQIDARTSDGRVSDPRPPAADHDDARLPTQAADNVVDLAAARGVLSRAAALIDQHRAANPTSDGTWRIWYVVPATPTGPIWVMAPMSGEQRRGKVRTTPR